jgi:hypothetical protein
MGKIYSCEIGRDIFRLQTIKTAWTMPRQSCKYELRMGTTNLWRVEIAQRDGARDDGESEIFVCSSWSAL